MPLSENDKVQILTTKENIRKLSTEISVLLVDSKKNRAEILDKMNQIIGHVADLCAISDYMNSEPNLPGFRRDYWAIQMMFEQDGRENVLRNHVERFCSRANSVIFHENVSLFSKMQIKLKNFNFINKPFSK